MSHKLQSPKSLDRVATVAGSPVRPPAVTLAPRWQALLSVVIAVHLLAVFVAPFAAPPSSPLAQTMFLGFRPWLDAAYLNHGYKFFVPNPGPSHLVRYVLEMPDGGKREGVFPNLQDQWPRLLYHRHFMLSEKVDGPPENPVLKLQAKSYAEHLLAQYGARKATLYLREHAIPSPQESLDGMKLSDPRLYREKPLYELTGGGP